MKYFKVLITEETAFPGEIVGDIDIVWNEEEERDYDIVANLPTGVLVFDATEEEFNNYNNLTNGEEIVIGEFDDVQDEDFDNFDC